MTPKLFYNLNKTLKFKSFLVLTSIFILKKTHVPLCLSGPFPFPTSIYLAHQTKPKLTKGGGGKWREKERLYLYLSLKQRRERESERSRRK